MAFVWPILNPRAGLPYPACDSRPPACAGRPGRFPADPGLLDDSLGIPGVVDRSADRAPGAAEGSGVVRPAQQAEVQSHPVTSLRQEKRGRIFSPAPKALGNGGVS